MAIFKTLHISSLVLAKNRPCFTATFQTKVNLKLPTCHQSLPSEMPHLLQYLMLSQGNIPSPAETETQ